MERECCSCKQVKNLELFNRNSHCKFGRQYSCAECERARKKNARLANIGLAREKEAARQRRRVEKGRSRVNALRSKNHAIRIRQDPKYALSKRVRSLIRLSLSNRAISKGGKKFRELLGLDVAELALHIEKQFSAGMSWDNMNMWHVDHIVPLSSFDIKEAGDSEFRRAWALANLRPLWADENRRKGNKMVFLI